MDEMMAVLKYMTTGSINNLTFSQRKIEGVYKGKPMMHA